MAIVVYRCNTCKREIELQRNITGLEHVGRCIITHGCRGQLYQVNVLPDYVRGTIPDSVNGLDDWKQRKVLHDHQQTIERDEWIIQHNMGGVPVVNVWGNRPAGDDDIRLEEILPTDVIINNDNNLTLVFDRPWAGVAQLIARQSDPDLFKPVEREEEITEEAIQLSSNGYITIATLDTTYTAPVLSVDVKYDSPTNQNPTLVYSANITPIADSPWNDVNKVVIQGRIYSVRTFSGVTPDMTNGNIGSGSTFFFEQASQAGVGDYDDISPGEMFILLATPPFDNVDKTLNQFIDVTQVSEDTNSFAFVYNNGEMYSYPSVVNTTYPYIYSV